MKRLIAALCLLAAASLYASAQELDSQKFEVRLGVSGYPWLPAIANDLGTTFGSYVPLDRSDLNHMYKDAHGPHYTFGNIGAEFAWHAKKKMDLCASLHIVPFWAETYDPYTNERTGTKSSATFSMLVSARFYYFKRPVVNLYSSIGTGILIDFSSGHDAAMHLQLVPLGISVGKKVFGFAELGLGTLFMGGNIGVGYRF